jgi:hypothetical protein
LQKADRSDQAGSGGASDPASGRAAQIAGIQSQWGEQVFNRLASGVRLSAAGELILHHNRNQIADT